MFRHSWIKLGVFLPVVLASCHGAAVRTQEAAARPAYEDSVYCFNGRMIVSSEGRKGLADTLGHVILPLEWEQVEFLDDDVALLGRAGLFYLCTADGRIFAESADREDLERDYIRLLSGLKEADSGQWDQVLDQLEALCASCLAAKPRHVDKKILEEKAALVSLLDGIPGRMSPEQEARLARIESRFIALYRR